MATLQQRELIHGLCVQDAGSTDLPLGQAVRVHHSAGLITLARRAHEQLAPTIKRIVEALGGALDDVGGELLRPSVPGCSVWCQIRIKLGQYGSDALAGERGDFGICQSDTDGLAQRQPGSFVRLDHLGYRGAERGPGRGEPDRLKVASHQLLVGKVQCRCANLAVDHRGRIGEEVLVVRAARSAVGHLQRDFPHFAEVVDLLKQRAALAMVSDDQTYTLPPVLLDGPPGVGKTAFVKAVARLLATPFQFVDVGSATAGFALAGNHRSWSNAQPGAVWRLLQSPSGSGVLLLDEVDKAADSRYPVLGPLYNLLEPSTARHFIDEYIEMPVDTTRICWFATCNDSNALEAALRSRFVEFCIKAPTAEQMPAVASSVYAELRSRSAWGSAFPAILPPEVVEALVDYTPRELVRVLESAVARAAATGRLHLTRNDVTSGRTAKKQQRKTSIGFIQE